MANGYIRPRRGFYATAQAVCGIVSAVIFQRKILRNELKGVKGPYVLIANHESALDFINLISAVRRPMSFVISYSFFNTLPIKGYLEKLGMIPKQQFQTTANDLKRMKAVVDAGEPVAIYPAGLMCEDGLSTPIPSATFKFLKWMDVDVYVAKSVGTYFVKPKWGKGLRPGRTYLDIYRLFTKEDLRALTIDQVKSITASELEFDAYREQEKAMSRYLGGSNIAGLENVLYRCPDCGEEFTIGLKDRHTLSCSNCGYEAVADRYGFFHCGGAKNPMRYVSDWSRWILEQERRKHAGGLQTPVSCDTSIHMIDFEKNAFREVGRGTLTVSTDGLCLEGAIGGEPVTVRIPADSMPTLPFSPGKYLELQRGKDIYRCRMDDGKLVMKYINLVKLNYQRCHETSCT